MPPLPLLLLGAGEGVPLRSVFVVLQIRLLLLLPPCRSSSVKWTRFLVALLSLLVVLRTLTEVGVFVDRSHSLVQC